jgi:hypothetical protein
MALAKKHSLNYSQKLAPSKSATAAKTEEELAYEEYLKQLELAVENH